MDSVRKANQRLRNYPLLVGKCAETGSAYAICVTRDLNVQLNSCDKEFQLFKQCLQKQATNMKTKL